jgi:hypothetical protein
MALTKRPLLGIGIALAAGLGSPASIASAQPIQTYTFDFFPELPIMGGQTSLSFDPRLAEPALAGATITQTRVFVTFTTLDGFDAGELGIQLTTPIFDSPGGGIILLTGADLGWSGEGTFTATIATEDLNGSIPVDGRFVCFFDMYRVESDPAIFSGSFSEDSRIELDYIPGQPPCAADFNGDGLANSQDYFDFLGAFFASASESDFNGDGAVDSQDYFDFLVAFFSGC